MGAIQCGGKHIGASTRPGWEVLQYGYPFTSQQAQGLYDYVAAAWQGTATAPSPLTHINQQLGTALNAQALGGGIDCYTDFEVTNLGSRAVEVETYGLQMAGRSSVSQTVFGLLDIDTVPHCGTVPGLPCSGVQGITTTACAPAFGPLLLDGNPGSTSVNRALGGTRRCSDLVIAPHATVKIPLDLQSTRPEMYTVYPRLVIRSMSATYQVTFPLLSESVAYISSANFICYGYRTADMQWSQEAPGTWGDCR